MRTLVFDLLGKFAHFRVFYANANALTYSFPPPTALTGTLAAILGMDRDSYYSLLSPENVRLAVRLMTPVRKRVVVVNYVRTNDTAVSAMKRGVFETYPARLEILFPEGEDFLRYRIYAHLRDKDLQRRLCEMIREGRSEYSIYLGISEFLGWTEFVGEYEARPTEAVEVDTVAPYSLFPHLNLERNREVLFERMPYSMLYDEATGFRKVGGTREYMFAGGGESLVFRDPVEVWGVGEDRVIWL